MTRRRRANFEGPSRLPEALLLTTAVGALLLVLILASLSTGAAVLLKSFPPQHQASAETLWVLCSGGRVVQFDPAPLEKQLRAGLGDPTVSSAGDWAAKYSARAFETGQLLVSGEAKAAVNKDFFQSSAHLELSVLVRSKPDQGEDLAALRKPGSDFLSFWPKKTIPKISFSSLSTRRASKVIRLRAIWPQRRVSE